MLTNKTHMYELNFFNKIIDAHKKGNAPFSPYCVGTLEE